MNAPASLPENILSDIGIYLAADEKILKALSPFGAGSSAAGQVWLILTSHSVIFHTCEIGREPLVALLARRDIREIEYFQKQSGVQLTFVPTGKTQQVSRLNFTPDKQEELEDFCEELADLINFKKETASGVKIYSNAQSAAKAAKAATVAATPTQQPQPSSQAVAKPAPQASRVDQPLSEEVELRHAASALKHSDKAAKVPVSAAMPAALPATAPTAKPSDKPATSAEQAAQARPVTEKPGKKPLFDPSEVKISKTPATDRSSESKVSGNDSLDIGYFITATLISLLVAFIWYKFFMLVAGWKEPRPR